MKVFQTYSTRVLATLLAISFTPLAHASDCTPVRLDRRGGTMERMTVLDQDSTDTCYAYVAAQLVDAYRHRRARQLLSAGTGTIADAEKQLKHRTSPLVAAVGFATMKGRDTVNGGFIDDAIQAIEADGSCSYKRIGDRFGAYDANGFLSELQTYFEGMSQRAPGDPIDPPPYPLDCCLTSDASAPLSRRNLERYLKANSFVGFLSQTFKAACQGNTLEIPSPPPPRSYYGFRETNLSSRRDGFRVALDALQSSQDLPVGITFCADVLEDRRANGVGPNGRPQNCNSHHSALVVGKRSASDGSCEYLVRNSFGNSCNAYDWECDERGQIWVGEKALLRNMTVTVVIE